MLTSYLSVMSLEKARILVEIFIGDWLHSCINNSNPQYGLLLWYYQFVRAETCWSLGFSFIVLAYIVYAWWNSSYIHEDDHYELMSMAFPNDSKEWWYEQLAELATLVTYFLWYSFVDLPYYWRPNRPPGILGITHKTTVTKWITGERVYNPLAYVLSTKYRYRWTLWHMNYLDLTRWTFTEFKTFVNVRTVAKTQTADGNGWFTKLGRPTNFTDRLKYFLQTGTSNIIKHQVMHGRRWNDPRSRHIGPVFLRARIHYRYAPIKKISKYVTYVNTIIRRHRKRRIRRYYNGRRESLKRWIWSIHRVRRKLVFRKKRYIKRALRRYMKACGVNMKRLSFNMRKRHNKYFNRGRFFVRYFRNIRTQKKLLPIQKQLQRHILKHGRKLSLVSRAKPMISRRFRYVYSRRKGFRRKTFYNPYRPDWHRWYWRRYYKRVKEDDRISRGVLMANELSANGYAFPSLFFYACQNVYCWEEDEFDMYEEEFEDWDLEFDAEMGELNDEDYDMEQDEELHTLEKKSSDTFEAIRYSELKQEISDGDAFTRLAEKINDEDYDEDDIVVEEAEDVDVDLLMLGVDYLAAIFEYFSDPVPYHQEKAQLHPVVGYEMPPAWGRLEDASTNTRNLYDRVGAMLYSYYYHNHVDLTDGVSVADYWWDSEPKSWRHDGQPRIYLSLAGADWKTFNTWYMQEYRLKKKETDPDFYAIILEVDKETRKTRPHFHGMAFSRGYYQTPKRDEGVFYENIINSLTEDRRKLWMEYADKVSKRVARHEYIADDDYLTFEDGKYNPFKNKENPPTK